MKAFRKPRELTWAPACVLLVLGMVFGFSGYLLPWDQLAFAGAKIALKSVAGRSRRSRRSRCWPARRSTHRASPHVGAVTLQRFFALHVAVMPTLFMPILGLHLWLVQKHGNAIPPSEQGKPTTKTMPVLPELPLQGSRRLAPLPEPAHRSSRRSSRGSSAKSPTSPSRCPPASTPSGTSCRSSSCSSSCPPRSLGIDGEIVGMGLFTLAAGRLGASSLSGTAGLGHRCPPEAHQLHRLRAAGGAHRSHHARLRRVAQELRTHVFPTLDIPVHRRAPGSSASSRSSTSSSATSASAAASTCRCSSSTRAKRATSRCSPT